MRYEIRGYSEDILVDDEKQTYITAQERIALLEKVAEVTEAAIKDGCIEYPPIWDALWEAGYLKEQGE